MASVGAHSINQTDQAFMMILHRIELLTFFYRLNALMQFEFVFFIFIFFVICAFVSV